MAAHLALPVVHDTKRVAEVRSKTAKRGNFVRCELNVPDHVTDVQPWLDRVYGNFDLIEVRDSKRDIGGAA